MNMCFGGKIWRISVSFSVQILCFDDVHHKLTVVINRLQHQMALVPMTTQKSSGFSAAQSNSNTSIYCLINAGSTPPSLAQHLHNLSIQGNTPSNRNHWPSVVWMLAQRLRRWSNIQTTLGEHFVISATVMLPQRWANVIGVGPALSRYSTEPRITGYRLISERRRLSSTPEVPHSR